MENYEVEFNEDKAKLVRYPPERKNKSYTIPAGVTSIGPWAFFYCFNLKSITIPAGVTSIGEWAFEDCEEIHVDTKSPEYSSSHGILFNKNKTLLIKYFKRYLIELSKPSSSTFFKNR